MLAGIYLTCTMAMTTLSMVLTVLVLNLHELSERPVPRWAQIVFLRYLSRLFCQRDPQCDAFAASHSAGAKSRPCATIIRTHSSTSPDKPLLPNVYAGGDTAAKRVQKEGEETNGGIPGAVRGPQLDGGYIVWERHRERRTMSASSSSHARPNYSADWHWLATVVDRLFFWSFLVTLIAISLYLFHPLIWMQWTSDETQYVDEV